MCRYHLKLGGQISLELEPAADPWVLGTRLGLLEGRYMKGTFLCSASPKFKILVSIYFQSRDWSLPHLVFWNGLLYQGSGLCLPHAE